MLGFSSLREIRGPVRSASSSPGASRGKSRRYGDRRSCRVAFDRAPGWRAETTAEDGVAEICEALEAGTVDKTVRTVTLDWYKELARWQQFPLRRPHVRKVRRESEITNGQAAATNPSFEGNYPEKSTKNFSEAFALRRFSSAVRPVGLGDTG